MSSRYYLSLFELPITIKTAFFFKLNKDFKFYKAFKKYNDFNPILN